MSDISARGFAAAAKRGDSKRQTESRESSRIASGKFRKLYHLLAFRFWALRKANTLPGFRGEPQRRRGVTFDSSCVANCWITAHQFPLKVVVTHAIRLVGERLQ